MALDERGKFGPELTIRRRKEHLVYFVVVEILSQEYGPGPYQIYEVTEMDSRIRTQLSKLEEL